MRNPILFFSFALLSCLNTTNLLAQQDIPLFWANQIGSAWFDDASDIYVDNSGDVYVTGTIDDPATLTPAAPSISLPFYGGKDAFIAKYDALGNVQYIHILGGEGEDFAEAVIADSLGNIYVTGWFEGTADFDPSEQTYNLTSDAGSRDAFLAKYDLNGNFIFAFSLGDNYEDRGSVLAIDSESNIIVGGIYNETIDFDPSSNTENLTSTWGGHDIFLAKYDSDGNYIFAISMGGNDIDEIRAIELDKDDFMHITGEISFAADFDPSNQQAIIGDIQWETYIAKYTPNGAYVYAKSFGGPETGDGGYALALDSLSNLYIAGIFKDTADLDPGPNEVLHYAEGVHTNIFLAKYNPNGEHIFSKSIGSTSLDQPYGMTMDGDENLYVTGRFGGTVDFDPSLSSDTIINAQAMFIAKYNNNGEYQYAQCSWGEGPEWGKAIDVFGEDNIYVAGSFRDNINFGSNGTENVVYNTEGYEDAFVARYTNRPNNITESATTPNQLKAYFSHQHLVVQLMSPESYNDATIQLFDLTGKLVFSKGQAITNPINTVLNVGSLNNGIYVVKLTVENEIYTTKVARF